MGTFNLNGLAGEWRARTSSEYAEDLQEALDAFSTAMRAVQRNDKEAAVRAIVLFGRIEALWPDAWAVGKYQLDIDAGDSQVMYGRILSRLEPHVQKAVRVLSGTRAKRN